MGTGKLGDFYWYVSFLVPESRLIIFIIHKDGSLEYLCVNARRLNLDPILLFQWHFP